MKGLPLFFLGGDGTTAADDSGCLSGGGHAFRGRPLLLGTVGDGVAGGGVNIIVGDFDKAVRDLFLLGSEKDDGDVAEDKRPEGWMYSEVSQKSAICSLASIIGTWN